MHALAKSMTLLPRSPTVIKRVNDWRKPLMAGWTMWPLRSCQVSISENQKLYQSSKNVTALSCILPPSKLSSQQDVSFLSLSFRFSVLAAHFQPSCQAFITLEAVLGFCAHRGKEFEKWIGMEGRKGHVDDWLQHWWLCDPERLSFNLSEPQIAHLWDEETCS